MEWALASLLAAAAVCYFVAGQTLARPDALVYDGLMSLAQRAPSDDIVIVAIDNESLRGLGRWPWPRARHAELLDRLAEARPKAIAYDVLFVEPDATPGADQDLARAVAAASPVFLPLLIEVPGRDGAGARAVEPAGPLAAAAAGTGQVNLDFDPDGVVRAVYLAESVGQERWPHLMELMRRQALGLGPPTPPAKGAPAAGMDLKREERMLIPFAGPPGHFRTAPFIDVLRGQVPAEFFRDKLVLVGATGDGLGDRYPTPLTSATEVMSGVELQANILDALLTGREVRPLSKPWLAVLSLVPLAVLMAGLLRLRPRANMVLGVALILVCLGTSAGLLAWAHLWAAPSAAIAGLVLVYPLWSWRRLEAANAYMIGELEAQRLEPALLPRPPAERGEDGGDAIGRQVGLLRQAIRETRDLRRFMSNTLDGLPDATLVIAADGTVLIANHAAQRLFARFRDRPPVGQRFADLAEDFRAADGAERLADPGASDIEGEVGTPDGATFHARYLPFSDSEGAFNGWIARFTDISAMKSAARQREELLQLLSHDMRSPQTSILALLSQARGAGISQETAQRVERYARHTLALADNFVNLARAESENYALEEIDLSHLLVDAVDDLWPQSRAKSITVETTGADQEYVVMADRTLMTRALVNLLDNAIKFSEAGSRIACGLAPGADGAQVVCTIRDQGRGMSPETLARLFERFHRASSGAERPVEGTGLGLSFVRAVLLRHGGRIDCASTPGEGTTFTLTLPLAEPSPEDAPRRD